MPTATIVNLSDLNLARTHWVAVTFPRELVKEFGNECSFRTTTNKLWRAVRGRTVGGKTVYRILCDEIDRKEVGELLNERHPKHRDGWTLHPLLGDDVPALIPSMSVLTAKGGQFEVIELPLVEGPTLEEIDAAHSRWSLRAWDKDSGLLFQWWADVYANDPVIDCWGKIVWSNRNDPSPNSEVLNMFLSCREGLRLDFARAHGLGAPLYANDRWWFKLNGGDGVQLQDGAGLPLSGVVVGSRDGASHEELSDSIAALGGPLVGVSHDWNGHWGPVRNVPKYPKSDRLDQDWEAFVRDQQVARGWFAARPVGSAANPGQTGDQEDFGATKGSYCVSDRDPRFLRVMQYSVYAELFRGINLLEADGLPLQLSKHPNWVTWDSVTHWHPNVSTDRLGKVGTANSGTGWRGYDDEHRSQNNLAAYALLTDDPLVMDIIERYKTLDLASYRSKYPAYGLGAARAQGRTVGAWAQLHSATGDPVWVSLIQERAMRALQLPTMSGGPMRVLAVGNPDGRKPIYQNGQLARWASMWEHGLAAVGFYKAFMQHGSPEVHEVLMRICETLATFGFFGEGNVWCTVADILWNNGAPPPGGMTSSSVELTYRTNIGDVCGWTFAGLLVAHKMLPDHEQLRRYVHAMAGPGPLWRRTGEWWATYY